MAERKLMKDVGFNDPVTVTLPAHVWHGYLVAYSATKWQCSDADAILREAVKALVDPVAIKEHEAAEAEMHDMMRAVITGRPPETPPNMEPPPHIEGDEA